MKIAVVILNYNGYSLLKEFLPSVIRSVEDFDAEVTVGDNASTDDSLLVLKEQFPDVRTIQFDNNYGFALGYNKALAQIEAEYMVLLNSDVYVESDWLKPLEFFMDNNPEYAACQPKILSQRNEDLFEYAGAAGGYMDYLGFPFCRGRIFNTVEHDIGQYDEIKNVFWASGACLFIRKKDFFDVRGLDADFFAHMEEIDLCWRLRNRNRLIACVPSSVIYHVGGGTLAAGNPRKTYLNYRNNLLMLFKNLPDSCVNRILFLRMLLDGIAALTMLLKADFDNFRSIIKAHRDFKSMKENFSDKRNTERQFFNSSSIPEILHHSIVFNYYIKGIKKFRNIKW